MPVDVVDLREFYLTPLGGVAQRLLRARLRRLWPQLRGERVMALGYGVPLLRPLLGEVASLMAMMPAEQGVSYWPREGPNIACFTETGALPLPDESVDRVVLLHALEGAADPHALLREVWRVMKSGGSMLAIVPNRHGLWAGSDATPFGTGQPYSTAQIKSMLRDHGFLTTKVSAALYVPPNAGRLILPLADRLEAWGARLCPTALGGALLVECSKQIYAPLLAKPRTPQRRLILPLPSFTDGGLPAPAPT